MASPSPDQDLLRTMSARFGHASFRPGQRETIEAALAGRDCLTILPTGGGKSVTYQLPALVRGRTTLVVSPLIALMRGQVESATAAGVRAAVIDSSQDAGARCATLRSARAGELDLLYASAEGAERVLEELGDARGRIGLLAIDEAHCISQWGHEFRPAYRMLGSLRETCGLGAPMLAVTAAATLTVAEDIVQSLRLRDPLLVRTPFFRDNLRICARRKERAGATREEVLALVRAHPGAATIVYRATRAGTVSLAAWLRGRGVAARPYHAGLETPLRAQVQDEFARGGCDVVVATVAFGMGVDKADVRLVVHADLPGSLEACAQEIGRAGRDGLPSDCVLLYAWTDVKRHDALSAGLAPERRRVVRSAARETFRFAAGGGCRHGRLAAHFGEKVAPPCGACDECGATSVARLLVSGGW
jgi:ATP-dependent DNA helicase RecQ